MRFNVKVTRWLGIYLNTGLQFWTHKNISLKKARCGDDRVQRLRLIHRLELGLIRQVQVATV